MFKAGGQLRPTRPSRDPDWQHDSAILNKLLPVNPNALVFSILEPKERNKESESKHLPCKNVI